jgi:hypothetical protein
MQSTFWHSFVLSGRLGEGIYNIPKLFLDSLSAQCFYLRHQKNDVNFIVSYRDIFDAYIETSQNRDRLLLKRKEKKYRKKH